MKKLIANLIASSAKEVNQENCKEVIGLPQAPKKESQK